jgi:methyltransferase (TIGR00027 family)
MRRAAHQIVDRPIVFTDPLAIQMVGGDQNFAPFKTRDSRSMRLFVSVRSRFAEDELAVSFRAGVRQYVLLGAGLDTFAYRNPYSPALQVFEADHPDTQAWKRERLRVNGIVVPESVRFVSVDLERKRLADELALEPDFDLHSKAFFACLGVVPYLTQEAFETTLRLIASMPVGSGIVFDYSVPPDLLNEADRVRLKELAERVAAVGETFRLFLAPQDLHQLLGGLGFTRVEDLERDEINTRYFPDGAPGIETASGHLVSART